MLAEAVLPIAVTPVLSILTIAADAPVTSNAREIIINAEIEILFIEITFIFFTPL
jgi:hypothetical protein